MDVEWRSGKKTLLGALGLHHNEVAMCRGLAWLLTPNGWHGLGAAVLDELLTALDLARDDSRTARVVLEESREDTRADIVVRFGATTLLIEAKIWAGEGAQQCDRLARLWDSETPTLVFLTRSGDQPRTAIASGGRWRPLRWTDIADMIESAIEGIVGVDVGVQEYLRTLRLYGGNATGNDDAQLDNLLRRWAGAEDLVAAPARSDDAEWAAIEDRARAAWRDAILAAEKRWSGGPDFIVEPRMGQLYICIQDDPLIQVVLNWAHNPHTRSSRQAIWPHVVIGVDPKRSGPLREAILEATDFAELTFGMVNTKTTPWWLRSGPIVPDADLTDVHSYADLCMTRLVEVWAAVRPVVDDLRRSMS
ncbi:hypothetical protein F0U44_12250 [Nocardioides humilatus]|uniref:PD-(D/E)XK nuclease superfamily protein n=1 Tax=Nocardioides humilatus TaxID=2607660 RepID=A0A5B1LEY2_9ACTN|nr:PD-(D/E)XK nuclease family protein [Nocardioides humilatus]KAA1419215.1 hypothetical protein F0U44_12250 [Nocardioides humilatus]